MKLHRPKTLYYSLLMILMGTIMAIFLMEDKWEGWDWWARYDWLFFMIVGAYGITLSFKKIKNTETNQNTNLS